MLHTHQPPLAHVPPVPPVSPISDRTFRTSNFKKEYDRAVAPDGPMELGGALKDLLRSYCRKHDIPWREEGKVFLKALEHEQ